MKGKTDLGAARALPPREFRITSEQRVIGQESSHTSRLYRSYLPLYEWQRSVLSTKDNRHTIVDAMEKSVAVYAGSFDPPTCGHLWMIEQGAALFDRLIVAAGINPEKRYLFTVEDRLEMLGRCTAHLSNVEVRSFSNQFLINFAKALCARFVLRGIRNESDYQQERVMRNVNGDLDPSITTVFLMPPRAIAEVSSSLVKGLVGPVGWEAAVQGYVPSAILERLRDAHNAKRA